MKKIAFANFIRGGKSSLTRLLGMTIDTAVLNLDPSRDSEHYNQGIVDTININENWKCTNKEHLIEIDTGDRMFDIKKDSDYILLDFGGRFDERLSQLKADIYIIPFCDDYESLAETIKATNYINEHTENAKIIHILNQMGCDNKIDKHKFLSDYKKLMKVNEIEVPYLEMPKSRLLKRIVNEGTTKQEIVGDSKFLKNNYKNIDKFTTKLIEKIKEELQNERNR